jgi:tRNA-2-methylthio-N6-dimethylallyladenosine synthase
MPRKKIWIETYGCQMNKAESEALLLDLAAEGWVAGDCAEEADLVVINTCSVRETAEDRIRGRLGYYRRLKKNRRFTLALIGCMAERLADRISADFPEVDVVAGTFRKKELARAVDLAGESGDRVFLTGGDKYPFARLHSTGGFHAYVPIMHGCNNFCSYCIVPFTRGREVSRDPNEILDEIRILDQRGVREITLLGQNVNSYRFGGHDGLVSFPSLMGMVCRAASGIRRIRFLTSHPRDFSDEILEVMASEPVLCRHIHLPVQSGSTRILKAMNRGYASEHYLRLVERIRGALRGVAVTTDILIGFPGETEEDFSETIDLMRKIGFDDAFMYYYNPREGTPAFRMENPVPVEVKLDRLARVIETQREIAADRMGMRLGNEVEVLVEGVSKKNSGELLARTEWDGMVVFPADSSFIGSFVNVRLEALRGNTYRGSKM